MNNKKYKIEYTNAFNPVDKANKKGYNESDPFLEGFNSSDPLKNTKKETNMFYNKEPKIKNLPVYTVQKPKVEKKSYSPDAIEFGEGSETYKILQDLGNRWYETSDSAEKDRLHGVAQDVRRLARGNNRVKYGTDEIFDTMHKNAKTGQLVRAASLGTIPVKALLANPLLAGVSGSLLEPSAFLTAMTDYGPWDYKRKSPWQAQGTVIVENGEKKKFSTEKTLMKVIAEIGFRGYILTVTLSAQTNSAI